MVSLKEMKILEGNAVGLGVSEADLMENAGQAVFKLIKDICRDKRIGIYCGAGNNGGDGFVLARYLAKVCDVQLLFIGDQQRLSTPALSNYLSILENSRIHIVTDKNQLNWADIWIDAIIGTGIHGKLREPIASAIYDFNERDGIKIALDIPSGMDPDSGKCATLTCKRDLIITLHDLKSGMEKLKERILVADIGIPKKATTHCGWGDVSACLPPRAKNSHKGQNGEVLMIGGSHKYSGCVALAGLAILRTGVDWVTVAVPEKVGEIIASLTPDLVVEKFPCKTFSKDQVADMLKLATKFDVVAIGNGMTVDAEPFITAFLSQNSLPVVIDADAIKVTSLLKLKNAILTPHKKEMKLLLKNSHLNTTNFTEHLASNVLVQKGAKDIIYSSTRKKINETGNPGMTKGGTGDVLSGLIAGFLAQSGDPFESACAGAFINGLIGDHLYKKHGGYSFIASDMVADIQRISINLRRILNCK